MNKSIKSFILAICFFLLFLSLTPHINASNSSRRINNFHSQKPPKPTKSPKPTIQPKCTPTPTIAPTATPTPTIVPTTTPTPTFTFNDEFNDNNLDVNKWEISTYSGSVINEGNNLLTLGSTNVQIANFPFIQSHEILNINPDYKFSARFRFDDSPIIDFTRKTGGIMIGLSNTKYDPSVTFGNSPYINGTNMWLYSDLNTNLNGIGTGHTYQTALMYDYFAYDQNWHILTVERTGGTTKILLDNNIIVTDSINIISPKYIFLGIPGSASYSGTWKQYPNLIIDYVRIN